MAAKPAGAATARGGREAAAGVGVLGSWRGQGTAFLSKYLE